MKEKLYELIQKQQETLFAMADQIHDDPEYDGEEYHASAMLEDYLEQHGFQVERAWKTGPLRSGPPGARGMAVPALAFCANTTPCGAWATAAAITCRAPASAPQPLR